MNHALLAVSFFVVASAVLLIAWRTAEQRGLTLGVGALALVLGGYAAWLAWVAPPAPEHDRGERLITIHGFAKPPAPGPLVAHEEDTPEQMITKLGCGVCHQIPGIASAQTGVEGPLLIGKVTAAQRIGSPAYQEAVREGRAAAQTPEEYVRESILSPNAFIVPGFEQRGSPLESAMPGHFKAAFTVAGLEKLSQYLLSLDCDAAAHEELKGPHVEPVDRLCGAPRDPAHGS
jgi:hypothetical protein